MGLISSKQQQIKHKFLFDDKERGSIREFYKSYLNPNHLFGYEIFTKDLFKNIQTKLVEFLNDYYKVKGINKVVTFNLDPVDVELLAEILIKSNMDTENETYFRKNSVLILYDISKGKVGAYNGDINIKELAEIFNFVTLIYIKKYTGNNSQTYHDEDNPFVGDHMLMVVDYLKENITCDNNGNVSQTSLREFVDNVLYNLDGFVKNFFRSKFLMLENEFSFLTALPVFTEPPSTLPIFKFFYFCLANPHVFSKSYAFKLWDCKKDGYNIPNMIYSFIGFNGPVCILIQHYGQDDREMILGMYLNSNFKECYEKFCGDDLSFIFTASPKLNFYKFLSNSDKIAFISSKNQKFSRVSPGIGMGFYNNMCRFWLDSNEPFQKSYFAKYDEAFEDGSPFENSIQYLNVINL